MGRIRTARYALGVARIVNHKNIPDIDAHRAAYLNHVFIVIVQSPIALICSGTGDGHPSKQREPWPIAMNVNYLSRLKRIDVIYAYPPTIHGYCLVKKCFAIARLTAVSRHRQGISRCHGLALRT